ncbi:bone morphogenetic protein 4 [Athalia rosae]|uniref:bone morphogenetic protein 4 n=1 Tax=Athalia rosae TaxID=37344 RepID=UPI0020337541|nr:bone morphogenetic protein 4 [Athalia rosae]
MGEYLIKSSESKENKVGETSEVITVAVEDRFTEGGIVERATRDSKIFASDLGGRWIRRKNSLQDKLYEGSSGSRAGNLRIKLTIVLLLAMTFARMTIASPTPSLKKIHRDSTQGSKSTTDYEDVVADGGNPRARSLRDFDRPEVDRPSFSNDDYAMDDDYSFQNIQDPPLESHELDKIRKSIMEDLGLARIPDPSKANVSQTEYENAHREYLRRVQLSANGQNKEQRTRRRLHVFYPADQPYVFSNDSSSEVMTRRSFPTNVTSTSASSLNNAHSIYFPIRIPSEEDHAVDHATLRLLVSGIRGDFEDNFYHDSEDPVEISVYRTTRSSRRLVSRQKILVDPSGPRWVEFDSTEAVASWIHEGAENFGFAMEASRKGAPLLWFPASPALNVFTVSEARSPGVRNRRATPDQLLSLHRGRRTECRGQNKKCCRHQMTVIFKDLKGFEFILQPKDFDAGYCKGRCPPRYNPAHHHALLQSLIWKEDRKKAPRPCCAPSKLAELEILYFDENDTTKLKVSNWKNMKVLECACS